MNRFEMPVQRGDIFRMRARYCRALSNPAKQAKQARRRWRVTRVIAHNQSAHVGFVSLQRGAQQTRLTLNVNWWLKHMTLVERKG